MSRHSRRALGGLAAAAVTASLLPLLGSLPQSAAQAASPGLANTPVTGTPSPANYFQRTATYPVFHNLPAHVPASAETVAEISDVTDDGKTLVYTDAVGKRIGILDISDPRNPQGEGSIDLTTLGNADDQPTSVAVHGEFVLVVIDTSGGDFTNPSGRLDVIRLASGKRVASIDLGGQPDSIALGKDGAFAAIAIENQRDEEATPAAGATGDLPQAPAGFVQVIALDGAPSMWSAQKVSFNAADGTALPEFVAAGIDTPADVEPEYVAINNRNALAVTLQENNGVALIDLATRAITDVFSAGTASVAGIDTAKDGVIDQTGSITDVVREPDAIDWIDDRYLATANEGDWKGGSRGWSVFDSTTGQVVWDAGASFSEELIRLGLHNEDRAGKKGPEPEGLMLGTFDGTRYAFVGSERSNAVLVYDMSDPANPVYVQALPTTNGPEGLVAIESRGMLAVASETDDAAAGVRAAVQLFQRGSAAPTFPSIQSADVTGKPIAWTALGALAAHPTQADTLYSASDAALNVPQIYTIDASSKPAVITSAATVTRGGTAATLDIEGIATRPDGGFWLASEGSTGAGNAVVRTNAQGEIQETVALPTEVSSKVGKWGLEGVTTTTDARGEHVWVALQRPLWTDGSEPTTAAEGDNTTRIGRYDVADKSWHWYGYELATPRRDGSDWMGLSEIVAVDNDTLAVVERDKLNGPKARVKRIYTVDVPAGDPTGLPVLKKTLAYDVLPDLRATNGWTQEKLEGLTIAADGAVFAVTDNDGLKDATGETVFMDLGPSTRVFADSLSTRTTLTAPATITVGGRANVTVAVNAASGGTATGSVTLNAGSITVGTAAVKGGKATFTVTGLKPGTHRLVATFTGSARSGASTAAATLRVTKANASLRVKAPASIRAKKPASIRVTVNAAGQRPSGKVQITSKGRVLAQGTLRQGTRTWKVKLKKTGTHTLQVRYLGDATTTAASSTVKVKVRKR